MAPAAPRNDGRQTPWRGHPVFIAQHATATCCRGCLAKWHRIARGQALSDEQIDHVLTVIQRWLRLEDAAGGANIAGEPSTEAHTEKPSGSEITLWENVSGTSNPEERDKQKRDA